MNRFDLAASSWDSNSKRVQIAQSAVENIIKHIPLKGDFDILDYGCGTGLLGFGLSEFAKSVTGMDSSKAMIDEFNKKANELGFKNANAIYHDIHDNHLPQNQFDMIASSMTLHHINDTNDFLEKCAFSLKENGYLCINDLVKEDGTFHEAGNDGVYHFGFDLEILRDLFLKNGFEVLFLDTVYVVKKSKDFPIFQAICKKMA